MRLDLDQARTFVGGLDLPAPRFGATGIALAPPVDFDAARDQAMVVGSEIVSFVHGITAEQRSDIVNCALLAQLRAKKVAPEPRSLAEVRDWYREYFDVLGNIGFVPQQTNLQQYETQADGFEAHQAVLDVAATLLGGAPTALALVASTVKALRKMDAGNPWITIFNRESRSANTAHFQVSTVDRDPNGELFVALTAFALEARQRITQVLFFKFRENDVKIENHAGKASINAALLAGLRAQISQKLLAHSNDYLSTLDI
jgi:dUTPase